MSATNLRVQQDQEPVHRPGAFDILLFSAWCGLAGGELEVFANVGFRALSSTQRLYLMTRHFVWLVPLVNMALFSGLGLALVMAIRLWPRRLRWLSPRLIVTAALLPALGQAGRHIYIEAWFLLSLGMAVRIVPFLERDSTRTRRWLVRTLPVLLGLVSLQSLWLFGNDQWKQWREDHRALPPAGSPNVLLVVLDTVRADHLSLYGYSRPTTPNLERFAQRGVRFDRARSAAPWTLASHANMFTGLWPHELGLQWTCPLSSDVPTLAEHLQTLGYATAGFAGNTFYCSYDSGLDRGFTHYQDYVLDKLSAVRTVHSINESLKIASKVLPISVLLQKDLSQGKRKHASVVNQEFGDWLTERPDPRRPFFAFLNYIDAHAPYLLPPGVPYRFGRAPQTDAAFQLLANDWTSADKRGMTDAAVTLARDSYDNCLAYIDDQLGALIDDLEGKHLLDNTLVIITADHGEGLGEHQLFEHGESLYRHEIRVPLLVLPPRGRNSFPDSVTEFVSLRSIATTIATFVSPGVRSPFPGRSLLALAPSTSTPAPPSDAFAQTALVLSELATPNPSDPNRGRSPAYRGSLVSLAEDDYVYIHNRGDGAEELYNERDDPNEIMNLALDATMSPLVGRFRERLTRATREPLNGFGSSPKVDKIGERR
jgi:arylsulfatase A-like enzyme